MLSLSCFFACGLLREEPEWASCMFNPSFLMALWIAVVILLLKWNILRNHVMLAFFMCSVCLLLWVLKSIYNGYRVLIGFQNFSEACGVGHFFFCPVALVLDVSKFISGVSYPDIKWKGGILLDKHISTGCFPVEFGVDLSFFHYFQLEIDQQ